MKLSKTMEGRAAFKFKFVTEYLRLEAAKGPVIEAKIRAKWLSLLQPIDLDIAFTLNNRESLPPGLEHVKTVPIHEPGYWNHYFFNSWQMEQETGSGGGFSIGPNIDLSKPPKVLVPVVVYSEYQKRNLLKKWPHYDPSLITVIPNMIDRSRFSLGQRASKPVVGWIGYDHPSKYTKGAEVIPYLAKRFPSVDFEMIHAEPPKYKQEWMKENLPNVKIMNSVPHSRMPEMMRRWHVLVCGSKWENCPSHIREAMACGVPVIAAKVAAIPEVAESQILLEDMKWGHPPVTSMPYEWTESSLNKFAEALYELLTEAGKAKRLSELAVQESMKGDPRKISDLWFQFMRKCRDSCQYNRPEGGA
ncbi:glycosyltransferase family 4 protein [Paenibacillus macerans]|uniref:glycosyltransferase family 4 protein n=1 Tax=Paenibacillus macerans TaxID=44252 RepID=UPI00203C5361|nr:glycosyltransferase family 4 protein [Paenibacillus macerans]MCM3700455.1 glycosyltransferase family 4 protein [Paenibacillus macerans]